jgi:hypothetical protein
MPITGQPPQERVRDNWTQQQTEAFIDQTSAALRNPRLSPQDRALLEADIDGARAYLRFLESLPKPPIKA